MDTSRFAAALPPQAPTSHSTVDDAPAATGQPLVSANTRRAYASDWKHFSAWCRRQGRAVLPPTADLIAGYIGDCAAGRADPTGRDKAPSTMARRLSSLSWNFAQRGFPIDRRDPQLANVIARLREAPRTDTGPSPAVMPDDLRAMLETVDRGTLRGLRDRAMLLVGYAGALRRSEVVGLDAGPDQTPDAAGWIEADPNGLRVTLRTRKGTRTIEIGRSSSDAICPVHAVETWLSLARIERGPLFRRVTGQGRAVGPDRLNDRELARLVNRTARSAGISDNLASRALRAGRLAEPRSTPESQAPRG
ncbi:integrase [Rhizobium sp. 0TCS1.26]|uniref:integrase n=1 Tax=Rhizobium sp. 0TCS1.26 TaxID=3142623 RepID=UPI003D26E037